MPEGEVDVPKVYKTSSICLGPTVTEVYVTVIFSGDILFFITADGGTNWEDLTLTSETRTKHTFTNSGTDVRFMAIGTGGAEITSTFTQTNNYDEPGIKVEITGHS